MFVFLDYLKFGAGIVAGAVIGGLVAHGAGVSQGRQEASIDALATAVTYYREKGVIKNEVDGADAAALCVDFGLPDDELAECVRGVRAAAAKPRNVGADPAQ